VSLEQFYKDVGDNLHNLNMGEEHHKNLELPTRATSGSAGYDFKAPFDFVVKAGEMILVPTGIRCCMAEDWVLKIYPRSGHGFKNGVRLRNTVGIVDQDYYYSEKNEGHIMVKLVNDNKEGKLLKVKTGEAFAQGVFVPFGITIDDCAAGVRNGGFGSTCEK